MSEKQEKLEFAARVVKRLIMQFEEYSLLQEKIKRLEDKIFLFKLKRGLSSPKLEGELELLKRDLQQISDEMTFANPLIWMMYKYGAYKGRPKEIKTVYDFRKHCEPDGYICTMRFRFLNEFLEKNQNLSLNDKKIFPNEMSLEELYQSEVVMNLLDNQKFMSQWKNNEYLKINNQVNKWNTLLS